jgi:hypothetical protein
MANSMGKWERRAVLRAGGRTIAVIGTGILSATYPAATPQNVAQFSGQPE